MRVVIVGAGEVGSNIAVDLAADHDVVVVDIDGDRVDSMSYSHDVLTVQGDGSDVSTLQEAGIEETDMLIASTDDDRTNIVTCGTADIFPDTFTIARVKSPQYLRTWERGERAFGVDFMVCTDLLTAQNITGVIGLPTARDVDTFADGLVQMAEFEVPPESPVVGQTVQEADRFASLTFAAVIREDGIVIPRGDTVIEPGDDVVVIGSPESAREFSSAIAPEQSVPRDIVVVGGSEIGYQTTRLLEARGFAPRLIEQDEGRARWLAEQLPDTTVMQSDATDREFLASTNEVFRPIYAKTGPDGALYVVDMHRGIFQHVRFLTDYLAEYILNNDLHKVPPSGRIYRVVPKNEDPRDVPDLGTLRHHVPQFLCLITHRSITPPRSRPRPRADRTFLRRPCRQSARPRRRVRAEADRRERPDRR